MFRVCEIKNANRRGSTHKKIESVPVKELFVRRNDERTVPYFSLVREQFLKDERLKQLRPTDRGLFLLLCMEIWAEGGMFFNFKEGNAERMGMIDAEWEMFQEKMLHLGLLELDSKKVYLVQPELREQYIHFLQAHSGGNKKDENTDNHIDNSF